MNKNKCKYDLNFYEQTIQDILDKSNYGFIGKQVLRSKFNRIIPTFVSETMINYTNPAESEWLKGISDYTFKPDTKYIEIDEGTYNYICKSVNIKRKSRYDPLKYDPLKPDFHRLFIAKSRSIRKKISINYTQDLLNSIKVGINIQVGD